MIAKRERASRMLEYFQFIDANPPRNVREVPDEHYDKLDRIYLMIKKLNEKGKPSKPKM